MTVAATIARIASITPADAVQAITISFAIGAAVAVGWMILTRPTLMRGLLSDSQGAIAASRIQLLLIAPAALFTTTTQQDQVGLVALGLSNLGYLAAKFRPLGSRTTGEDQ